MASVALAKTFQAVAAVVVMLLNGLWPFLDNSRYTFALVVSLSLFLPFFGCSGEILVCSLSSTYKGSALGA